MGAPIAVQAVDFANMSAGLPGPTVVCVTTFVNPGIVVTPPGVVVTVGGPVLTVPGTTVV